VNSPKLFGTNHQANSKSRRRRRRPTGVSRRQQRHHLGFETLEDRRVMSAQSPIGPVQSDVGLATSYSSATAEGLAAQLQAELVRYALISANNGPAELQASSLPTDELFEDQWYLLNVGQEVGNPFLQTIFGVPGEDINYFGARELGYTGAGVLVAVIDTGVQLDHPDLNIDPALQFDAINLDGDASPLLFPFDPNNPFATYVPENAHGTAIAGIIAALENGEGTVGIAPGAQIVPIRALDALAGNALSLNDSIRFATANADIANYSFGPVDGLRQLAGPTALEISALQDSIFGPNAGRNGLGAIHVFAAGNGAQGLDSASYDGFVNSRYTIGVTGVAGPESLGDIPPGTVYIAEQMSTGVERALKLLHPQLVTDPRARKLFHEEARIGGRIPSEHVVEVLASGVDETTGVPWLAMELLQGDDLGTLEGGKLADSVLLDANPLEDIKNTQTIWRVIKGGWLFDPEKLRPPVSTSAKE